jgi:hypothetical protein
MRVTTGLCYPRAISHGGCSGAWVAKALASVTWLSHNGVLVSCYELKAALMGERHVMRFEKVAPPPAAEEFYIGCHLLCRLVPGCGKATRKTLST